MTIQDEILTTMKEVAKFTERPLIDEIEKKTPLLECGLDSLGFAILVSRLEEKLGYDPFSENEEQAVYPTTFIEFVTMYEKHQRE